MKKLHLIALVVVIAVLGFAMSQPSAVVNSRGVANFNEPNSGSTLDPTACVQPPAGLVSWYRGEGNFVDSTGGNSGTESGGVGFAPGRVGQAFNLDGSNDIISMGNAANLQLTAVTAEAWIRPDTQFPNFRTVVSKWSQTSQASWGLFVTATQDGSANRLYAIVAGSNGAFTDAQGGSIPTSTTAAFTHVAMTYSAADGLRLYMNGVLVDSDASVGNLRIGTDVLRIGNDSGLVGIRYFDGLVDEVDVFNRALSPAEILAIFNAGSDGKCTGPPVSPSPTPTPDCNTFLVSPRGASYFSPSVPGRLTLDVAAGCDWNAVSTESWLTLPDPTGTGPQDIIYNVAENRGAYRSGAVCVATTPSSNAQCHYVGQNERGDCPSERAAGDLTHLYGFRNEVLAATPRGRKYTNDYYLYAGEITRLMIFNPRLFFRAKDVFGRYAPVVESVLEHERSRADLRETHGFVATGPTIVYDSEIDDIDAILKDFGEESSARLRETLEALRQDIRDPQVQAEFGVRVVPGEKRPLREQKQDRIFGDLSLIDLPSRLQFLNPFSAPASKPAVTQGDRAGHQQPVAADVYGRIPLSFESNKGQVDGKVKYLARGVGYNLFLTASEAVLSLPVKTGDRKLKNEFDDPHLLARISDSNTQLPSSTVSTLRMKLDGANPQPRVAGADELPGKSNYFIGSDSNKWRAGVPNFSRIEYEQVYEGVDLVFYGNQRQLEYDFKVAPGADPRQIKMKFAGAESLKLDENGDLILQTDAGEVRMLKPVTYQEIGGIQREIASRYALSQISNLNSETSDSFAVGFEVAEYDTSKPLVIDPVLVYSTYLGGSGEDNANSIAVDTAGNAYIIGFTDSTNFPVAGAVHTTYGGNPQDVFVSKINAAGTGLVYSTYLGGSGQDNGSDIAVDAAGNAYITGYTGSTNFPTANALQASRSGLYNAFVAKLNPTGSQLVYSTYYGGATGEYGSAIAIDPSGSVYLGGVTSSVNFPDTPNAVQANFGGSLADAFVTKLNPAGNQVVYATFLGGNGNDGVTSIAIDSQGNAYVTGVTFSTNFPTASPLQTNFRGGAFDAFVSKINATGTSLVYSTYLGGTDEDRGFRIALDGANNVYVAGQTLSSNFPTAAALQPTFGGGSDAFVTRLNPAGAITYSTFLGGSGLDGATGFAVGAAGDAYVTGFTTSTNFPLADASQSSYGGGEFDAFAAKLNPGGASLDYSTYLGGAGYDTGFDIATDSAGNAYLLGRTASTNFPVANPFQAANGGSFDVFLTKLSTNVTISGRVTTPTGLALRSAAVTLTDSQGVRRTASTSPFGLYSFENVRSGGAYIVSVSSKRYRFSPRNLSAGGNVANVDFVGLE